MQSAYIFLTPSIAEIGGAERYLNAKVSWLVENGWDVYILSQYSGKLPFEYEGAELVCFPELAAKPYCVKKARIDRLLETMQRNLQKYELIYIESSTIQISFWGEMLASKVGGRHLLFHLGEKAPNLSRREIEYLSFKASRNEFACITEDVFTRAFSGINIPRENMSESRVLTAWMGDPVQDVSFDDSVIPPSDFRIGCLSRLDKPYLEQALKSVRAFCAHHKSKKIACVLIGDSALCGSRERLEDICRDVSNCSLTFLGAMSPIPKNLLQSFDVVMAKAGSAIVAAREGVPTIVYGIEDDACRGVVGLECADKEISAEFLLKEILIDDKYKGVDLKSKVAAYKPPKFEEHFKFVEPRCNERMHFDTRRLRPSARSFASSLWALAFREHPYAALARFKSMF